MPEPHLWEARHPYYCAEGNFYRRGCHNLCESWREFFETVSGWDHDLNLLFRWDWFRPVDIEPEDHGSDRLLTFWVGQRKALIYSYECPVTPDDEPAVRAWLTERAKTVAAIWQPLSLAMAGEATND